MNEAETLGDLHPQNKAVRKGMWGLKWVWWPHCWPCRRVLARERELKPAPVHNNSVAPGLVQFLHQFQCVCVCPSSSKSLIPARCPVIQLSSDTIYPEIVSPHNQGLRPADWVCCNLCLPGKVNSFQGLLTEVPTTPFLGSIHLLE